MKRNLIASNMVWKQKLKALQQKIVGLYREKRGCVFLHILFIVYHLNLAFLA